MATSEQSVQQGPTGNIMEIKFDPLRFINRMVLILLLSTSILSNEIRITQLNYETGYTILKKEKLDVIQDFSKEQFKLKEGGVTHSATTSSAILTMNPISSSITTNTINPIFKTTDTGC
ncbi:unnamed protein product [Ceratitis capitata]|uniref:(Mediterranean fruit fly) hypothetical protein n=1 Tax=Ceratitis capitata TaxID=7213 RepID=A0A811V6J4_CERCA|nr:unnamed protein product [Ceratitis capitata]